MRVPVSAILSTLTGLLISEDIDQTKTLSTVKVWYKVGRYLVKFSPWTWSAENATKDQVVLSYGGWMKIRNLPLDRWDNDTLMFIGEACGGFLEISEKPLRRLDLFEASRRSTEIIKVSFHL